MDTFEICSMCWDNGSKSRSEITKNEKFTNRSKNLFRDLFGLSKMPETIVQLRKLISRRHREQKPTSNCFTQFICEYTRDTRILYASRGNYVVGGYGSLREAKG